MKNIFKNSFGLLIAFAVTLIVLLISGILIFKYLDKDALSIYSIVVSGVALAASILYSFHLFYVQNKDQKNRDDRNDEKILEITNKVNQHLEKINRSEEIKFKEMALEWKYAYIKLKRSLEIDIRHNSQMFIDDFKNNSHHTISKDVDLTSISKIQKQLNILKNEKNHELIEVINLLSFWINILVERIYSTDHNFWTFRPHSDEKLISRSDFIWRDYNMLNEAICSNSQIIFEYFFKRYCGDTQCNFGLHDFTIWEGENWFSFNVVDENDKSECKSIFILIKNGHFKYIHGAGKSKIENGTLNDKIYHINNGEIFEGAIPFVYYKTK